MPISQAQQALQDSKFKYAAKNANTDDARYQAAVEKARQDFSGQDVDRRTFKNAIDTNFKNYGGTKTGREMRGENAWTDFVQGVNDLTHGVNTGIGNLVDAGWDTVVGGIGDMISPEFGNDIRNFGTGEDLAIVPDILSDVLLTMSTVGIPLVVAKEGFRNADNFNSAISGKDPITLEELTPEQRALRGLMGVGTTSLAALPGISKLKGAWNAADKKLIEGASKAAGERKIATEKAVQDAEEKSLYQLAKPGKPLSEEGKKALDKAKEGAFDDTAEITAAKAARDAAVEEAKKWESRLNQSQFERALGILGSDVRGFGEGFTEIPEVFGKSLQDVKDSKTIASVMRKANRAVKKSKTNEKGERELSYEKAFKDIANESEDIPAAVKNLGYENIDSLYSRVPRALNGEEIGKFVPRKIQLARRGTPGIKHAISQIGKNFGSKSITEASNSAFHRKGVLDAMGKLEESAKHLDELGDKATALDRAKHSLLEYNAKQSRNPFSAKNYAIQRALGMGAAVPIQVLGEQAQGGGSFGDAASRLFKNRRPASWLSAMFPVASGRTLSYGSLPMRGNLYSNLPYAAIRSAAEGHQAQELSNAIENPRTMEQAIENINKKGKK